MPIVRPCLAVIVASLLLSGMGRAEEEPFVGNIDVRNIGDAPQRSSAALLAVPSFQGELPDGTPVYAIIVIPAENVLKKNAAWQAWERQWLTTYQVHPAAGDTSSN